MTKREEMVERLVHARMALEDAMEMADYLALESGRSTQEIIADRVSDSLATAARGLIADAIARLRPVV